VVNVQSNKDIGAKMKLLGLIFRLSRLIIGMIFVCSNGLLLASTGKVEYQARGSGKFEAQHYFSHVFKKGIRAQEGNFSISKTGLRVNNTYTFENGLPLEYSLTFDHYKLNDSSVVKLPSSLQSKGMNLGTKIPMPFLPKGRVFLGIDAGTSLQTANDHGFYSDSLRFNSRLTGIYRRGQDLIMAAGVMIRSGYDSRPVIPFIGFRYMLNERWTINALSMEPSVVYRLTDKTALKWLFSGYRDEFEVNGGTRDGQIVTISEFHAGISIEHDVTEDMRFQVSSGWAFNRKYEYSNNGGKIVPDDGILIGWSLKAAF
jgi:hypothetical protein